MAKFYKNPARANARIKKLQSREWPSTQKGWIQRWQRQLVKIRNKAIDLWATRETFEEFWDAVQGNSQLDKSAPFITLVYDLYLRHLLVEIRTFDDDDLRSYSLFNLIEEIRDNAQQCDRTWFVSRYKLRNQGEHDFRSWMGKTHISSTVVDRDLRLLYRTCLRIRRTANGYVAHHSRRPILKPASHDEVDDAIAVIYDLVSKYQALLTGRTLATPTNLPTSHIFKIPWLV